MSFISAYLKGEKAFKDGLSLEDNPYKPVTLLNERGENSEWQRKQEHDWWDGGFFDAHAYEIEKTEVS